MDDIDTINWETRVNEQLSDIRATITEINNTLRAYQR